MPWTQGQPTRPGQLTDSTTGATPSAATLQDVGASPSQSIINNNFARLINRVNFLEQLAKDRKWSKLMKEFLVPAPIQCIEPVSKSPIGGPVSIATYAAKCWLNDNRLGGTPVKIARLGKILDRFLATETRVVDGEIVPGATRIRLEDADYEAVKPAVLSSTDPYKPLIEVQLQAFPQAFLGATDVTDEPAK